MAFKIEIQHNSSILSFVPRTYGQTGRDILAVKMALGLIKEINNGKVVSHTSEAQDVELSQGVPFDSQNWFDCQTGLGTDLKTACRFDARLQSAVVAFQVENRFLITNYLFEKFSTERIIELTSTFSTVPSSEYSLVVQSETESSNSMYDDELGTLGEATLAVMHGWRPQTIISNSGYVHDKNLFGSSDKVVDIIPEALWDLTTGPSREKMAEQGILNRTVAGPAVSFGLNDTPRLEVFRSTAPSHRKWIIDVGHPLHEAFQYYGVDYRVVWSNTSALTSAARIVINQTEEFGDIALLGPQELRERMNNFFYPDPFSTSKPFIIDEERIGFFYETEFMLSSSGPLPTNIDQEIRTIEDKALHQVLEFYGKPKVWNFLLDDEGFLSKFKPDAATGSPDHLGSFPIQISQERVRSSKAFRALELKEKLAQEQVARLKQSLDTDQSRPSHPRTFTSREEFELHVENNIVIARGAIEEARELMRKALRDGIFKKLDFWVVTTQETMNSLESNQAQHWRAIETGAANPLIKFIEYRTPSLRPGHKFRALLEINRDKLDLIIHGDSPEQELGTDRSALTGGDSASRVKVCANESPEESKRTYEEHRVHAQKKRRELARKIREKVQEELDVTTVDMGPMGPFNLNNAFPGLYGLSGITDDYEYTSKALRLLVDSGSTILEELGIFDSSAESLNGILSDANPDLSNASPDEIEDSARADFGQIVMTWEEFGKRIETGSEDLSEAARTIEKESIKFKRGSNFKPKNEAQLLKRATSQIKELMDDEKILSDKDIALSTILKIHKEDKVLIQINFDPASYEDLGPKNGKLISKIAISIQNVGLFGEAKSKPMQLSSVVFDNSASTIGNFTRLQEFESLSRPRTVNYISQIGNMTNPFPSTFKGFIKSFWDDKRLSCSQLGIDSEKGIALSLVGSYTTGIAVDLEDDEEGLTEALKDWAKKNFKDPAVKWVDQSAKNMSDSLKNTFDEEEALKAFGKLCTLEDLYKEFIDKVDLKSLLCDYLKCIGLPAFEFKLPNLYLPPFPKIPILGWYGGLWKFLEEQFKQILIRILCTFVRTLIDKLAFPFCEEQLEEFIAAGSSATPIMNKALADALTNTGITSGNKEKAKDYFEDVSKLTTGNELCHLLKGKPLDAAGMQMLRRMVEASGLSEDLDSDEAIVNYFGVLGTYIPFEICEELENLTSASAELGSVDSKSCSELASSLRAIRNRLQTGDSNLSDQEIEDVLELAQKNLDDRKAEIDALSGSDLQFAIPDHFGANSKHIINTNLPPAMKMTIKQISEDLFLPAKSVYSSCLSNYVAAMKIQTPNSPKAGDDAYDQDSTLTIEACLEQLRLYSESVRQTSASQFDLNGALDASGFFEQAKYSGLGNWSLLSRPGAGRPIGLGFLDPGRDLENPVIRAENQEMIESLIKQDMGRTLKVKQIISAFTIFENFGHYPAGAWAHWAYKFYKPITTTPAIANYLDDDEISGTFSNWWRVRPSGTGLNNTIEEATRWLDFANNPLQHSDRATRVGEPTHHGMARNWNVTVSLRESRWYRGWIGEFNQDNLESIYFPDPAAPAEEITKRTDLLDLWFNKIDSVEWNSWLELVMQDPTAGEAPAYQFPNDLYNHEHRLGKYKVSLQDYSSTPPRVDTLLQGAVDFFYGEEPPPDPPKWYDRPWDYYVDPAMRRQYLFGELLGSPLFLVGSPDGKDFLPDVDFGTRIMTNTEAFASGNAEGSDLFLPLADQEDFQMTYPERFLNDQNLPNDDGMSIWAAGINHEYGPAWTTDIGRRGDYLKRKIVPPNSELAIRSSFQDLGRDRADNDHYVSMVLGHPFQECRVWSPAQITERDGNQVQPYQPGFRWGTPVNDVTVISYQSQANDFLGTFRSYSFSHLTNLLDENGAVINYSDNGLMFYPKSHFQLAPNKWWTSVSLSLHGLDNENMAYGMRDEMHRITGQGDRYRHGRNDAYMTTAGMSDWYFMNHKEQHLPIAPGARPTAMLRPGTWWPAKGDHAPQAWAWWDARIQEQEGYRDEHYARASKQLYMKIVQEASAYAMASEHTTLATPFHDRLSLTRFVMGALRARIEILEQAMVHYGTKNTGAFQSAFSGVNLPAPFQGFGSSSVSILPADVGELFTLFETERIYKLGAPRDNNAENFHLVHRRYYKEPDGRESQIPYREFIRLMRNPLLNDADKREFYLKPIRMEDSVVDILTEPANPMYYRNDADGREIFNPNVIFSLLGRIGSENRGLSDDLFFLDLENLESLQQPIMQSTKATAQRLLLDDDHDNLVELDLAGINLTSYDEAKTAFANNPQLLALASTRMNKLTTVITQILQTLNSGFGFALLPTISSVFELISKSHPTLGSNLNAVYNLISRNQQPVAAEIGLKVGYGPYSPGINLVDYPSTTGSEDRYNIVIDSDTNLNLGADFKMKQNPFSQNPDSLNPDNLNSSDTNSRKIMRFCDLLPESLRQEGRENPEDKRFNKRDAFAKLLVEKISNGNSESLESGENIHSADLRESLQREVYDEISSNIMNTLSDELSRSPLFDEGYSDDLEARVSGKPTITTTGSGKCLSNRYSLEEASILSFKEAVLGDAFQEVLVEMQLPENSPFDRSPDKLEPFDKAMMTISVKGFIRICLIELMLKGGLAYSIWDIESIVGSPIFIEYVKEHVKKELEKNKTMSPIWQSVLEKSTGLNNQNSALDKVVREEVLKLPQYSQQIFHGNSSNMDFYNWFAYGKTLLPGELPPIATLGNARNFYQESGLFYELPVPEGSIADMPAFGRTHLGSSLTVPSVGMSDSLRSFPKSDYLINQLASDDKASFNEGQSDSPTAKLFFENYVRASGQILSYFSFSSRPTPMNRDSMSQEWVFSFEEFNFAIEQLQRLPAEELISIMQSSTVKIGKRLSLLLNRGNRNDPEFEDSFIPEIIRLLDSAPISRRERAYRVKVGIDAIPFDDREARRDQEGFERQPTEFKIATVPLTFHEQLIDPGDCEEVQGIFQTGFRPSENREHNEFLLKISQEFSEQQEFKNYLEHLFPVRRFMTMSSIFATSILGGYNDLPTLMKSAKTMVAFVGLSASTPTSQRSQMLNLDQADFSKHVREQYPGDPDDPKCFDFPGLGKEFWDAFWEEIKKLVKYFPSILFRGVANQLDPAYKEMRAHYLNCDIRKLTWEGLNWSSDRRHKLVNGLRVGSSTNTNSPNGKYVNILTAAPLDLGLGVAELFYGRTKPLESSVLKLITYIYSGMIPFVDLGFAFKIPCADIDISWKEDEKYDFGKYGRYGHPVSPFTALALSTLQLPADKDKRKSNCEIEEEEIVLEDCDDEQPND